VPSELDEEAGGLIGAVVGVSWHFVQIVLVEVIRTVLVDTPTLVVVTPLEVWVSVTGHSVVEVRMISVTVVSPAGVVSIPADEEVALDSIVVALDSGVVAGGEMMIVVDEGASEEFVCEDVGLSTGEEGASEDFVEVAGDDAGVVSVAVTGQIVVDTGTTTVVKTVE